MATEWDPGAFRRKLAENVSAKLHPDHTRISPQFGEAYTDSNANEAEALRRRDGTFEWVAFGFDPHSMWDMHVGVLTAKGSVTAGFHIHERLSSTRPTVVDPVANKFDAEYRYSEAATEHQFNRAPTTLSVVDADALAGIVAAMCRWFEPVVDELASSE